MWLEFMFAELPEQLGYLLVAPGGVVEVLYVGAPDTQEEDGWVFGRRAVSRSGVGSSGDAGWLPGVALRQPAPEPGPDAAAC